MELHELTEAMHQFVHAKRWYDADSKRPQTLRNLAISLNLEAAEVLEHFQWSDEGTRLDDLADELADVSLYLLQLASIAGIDLEKAIIDKLQRNYERSWDNQQNDPNIDLENR